MRVRFAVPTLLLALSACTPGGLGGAPVEGQPTAAADDGLSLSVVSVEPGSDKTTVEMVVVNGGSRPETVSRQYAPMTLTDGDGGEHAAAKQEIEVPAYSSDRLRVEFAGHAEGERMTLTAGDLTIPDLPTDATRFEAGPSPAAGSLAAVQANHANGSSLRVTGVTFDETGTSVQVEAVNGHDGEIKLSGSTSDPAHLADETGRTYPLVPPQANPDLSVREGQALRGTLRFAGRVPASVRRLTLAFNAEYGGDQDYASSPRLTLDIPIASPPAE